MILSHSFVQQLSGDLEQHFDDRAKSNFNLEDVKVRLFGVGGRTVNKIEPFDLMSPFFAPDFVISEIGTNDLCNLHTSCSLKHTNDKWAGRNKTPTKTFQSVYTKRRLFGIC